MRQVVRFAGSVAAVLLAAAALLIGGWFVYSATTGATLVIFRTGSMSPTMPQGALAISVPVDASEIELGDVVTVDRTSEGRPPITHRVIEIRPSDQPDSVEILMQGDANQSPDRETYVVSEVHRIVASAPNLGTALMVVQSPIGMGVLTLAAGLLTVWAFWPASGPKSKETPAELEPDESEPESTSKPRDTSSRLDPTAKTQ